MLRLLHSALFTSFLLLLVTPFGQVLLLTLSSRRYPTRLTTISPAWWCLSGPGASSPTTPAFSSTSVRPCRPAVASARRLSTSAWWLSTSASPLSISVSCRVILAWLSTRGDVMQFYLEAQRSNGIKILKIKCLNSVSGMSCRFHLCSSLVNKDEWK